MSESRSFEIRNNSRCTSLPHSGSRSRNPTAFQSKVIALNDHLRFQFATRKGGRFITFPAFRISAARPRQFSHAQLNRRFLARFSPSLTLRWMAVASSQLLNGNNVDAARWLFAAFLYPDGGKARRDFPHSFLITSHCKKGTVGFLFSASFPFFLSFIRIVFVRTREDKTNDQCGLLCAIVSLLILFLGETADGDRERNKIKTEQQHFNNTPPPPFPLPGFPKKQQNKRNVDYRFTVIMFTRNQRWGLLYICV